MKLMGGVASTIICPHASAGAPASQLAARKGRGSRQLAGLEGWSQSAPPHSSILIPIT
jgi:hypothetical protein